MKRTYLLIILVIFIGTGFWLFQGDFFTNPRITQNNIRKIVPGMSFTEVQQILGDPIWKQEDLQYGGDIKDGDINGNMKVRVRCFARSKFPKKSLASIFVHFNSYNDRVVNISIKTNDWFGEEKGIFSREKGWGYETPIFKEYFPA